MMFKRFLLSGLLMSLSLLAISQIDIADARTMSEGTTVTVEGIATNGGELGVIRYLQDATGAIAVYPGNGSVGDFADDVARGTLVNVTGELKIYNDLLEIDVLTAYTVVSDNNTLPAAKLITPNGVNQEVNEALLLKVEEVTFDDAGGVFGVGTYGFSAGGESAIIYVRSNHPLVGTAIPFAAVNLTGIGSQFSSGYQLLPRDLDDLEIADQFFISKAPEQTNITTDGFELNWETNMPGSSVVRYGDTPALGQEATVGGTTMNHSVTLDGLDAATFYYAQVVSNNGAEEALGSLLRYSTASNSSGGVRVYFTDKVDGNFSNGSFASGYSGAAIEAAIIEKIDNAMTSIDASVYNINRETIVAALTAAHDRGVVVRYVADNGTANLALGNPVPPFEILKGNSAGLMHNKYFAIDVDSEDDSWVIMGSTNMTDGNLSNDFNNTLFIQDQALVKAYVEEFQEMWGSDGPSPGFFTAAFGPDKVNNTPHKFLVNGFEVESYFSPSDNTTNAITNALKTADTDIQFALLTFTHNSLGTEILNQHNAGVDVRGIIDNINDQGGEYAYLDDNGVSVTPDNTTRSTHHKYCIVDATAPNSDPMVITGSHNWSASAEDRNDENTLILHNASLANIYLQEFEARWCETQGSANCTTKVGDLLSEAFEYTMYPNPTSDQLNVKIELDRKQELMLTLRDVNGHYLEVALFPQANGTFNTSLDLSAYAAGQYILTLHNEGKTSSKFVTVQH